MRILLALSLLTAWIGGDDRLPFSDRDRNFKLTYPFSWEEVQVPPGSPVQLALKKGQSIIVVSAMEMRVALEEFQALVERDIQRRPGFDKIVSKASAKVAGEQAVQTKARIREGGRTIHLHSTTFVHQGIAYRFYGSPVGGNEKAFLQDFNSVLKSVEFLGDRRDWLAKYKGIRRPTALWGGLASFAIDRPRWQESALGNPQYPLYREDLQFRFWAGGSLLYARIRETEQNEAQELRDVQDEMAAWMKDVKIKKMSHTVDGKPFQYSLITGEFKGFLYVIRTAVKIENGVAVHVWLEGPKSQQSETQRDWQTVMETLKLQNVANAKADMAFPWRSSATRSDFPENAALSVFLGKAKRVTSGRKMGQYLTISPDGKKAILQKDGRYFLTDLATRQQQPLRMFSPPSGPIAWSRDGTKIAYREQKSTVVLDVVKNKGNRSPVTAAGVAFGPRPNQLLLCSRSSTDTDRFELYSNGIGQKLELLDTASGLRKTLLEFPLARIGVPAVSPDGKHIALMTNRDYPRTASNGGHVYVCNADGSGLRQLTDGPEDIRRVVWTDDGNSLLVIRRLAVGKNGAVGKGGQYDLYRVDMASGETVNLTKSGNINNVWSAGDDVLLNVSAIPYNASQSGLFRVPLKTLEKQTAKLPAPPISNPPVQARKLAQRLRVSLGDTSWKKTIPAAEIMARLAKDFADAVSEIYAKKLDFNPGSLNTLQNLCLDLPLRKGGDPILILGAGAYYGETLRKTIGAEWRLKPVPFGEWRPQWKRLANSIVEVVLPFSHVYAHGANDYGMFMLDAMNIQNRGPGGETILVYPPTFAESVFKETSPKEYETAMDDLDEGKLFSAFAKFQQLLKKHPKNQRFAESVVTYCDQANLADLADEITADVVKGGNGSPELLLRYGDLLMKKSANEALPIYQKAVAGQSPIARAFIQLGKCYQRLGNLPVAESCWRVAYRRGLAQERQEVLQLMQNARLFPTANDISNR